jgi:hypothetical protein
MMWFNEPYVLNSFPPGYLSVSDLLADLQGQAMAQRIGAHSFIECSARTSEGVEDVFENAVRAPLIKLKPPRRINCIIA